MTTPKDIDDELQALFDKSDTNNLTQQAIIEYCHIHKTIIAVYIDEVYNKPRISAAVKGE